MVCIYDAKYGYCICVIGRPCSKGLISNLLQRHKANNEPDSYSSSTSRVGQQIERQASDIYYGNDCDMSGHDTWQRHALLWEGPLRREGLLPFVDVD